MEERIQQLPEKFVERVRLVVPQEKQAEVFAAFCKKKPITFRANTVKISADVLEQQLSALNITTERVSWYPDAFLLHGEKAQLMETDLYRNGCLYIQSLSSMIPALILNPKFDETILDMAAAPGSKTTQIAAMMRNEGLIVANDISPARMFKLKSNLEQQGVTNTKLLRIQGQFLWKKFPEYFDKTLLDAPCSLEGRFNCNDPKSYVGWSPKKVALLSQKERFLLRSAISATKPGGIIVYSTCTLSPEENEEVIDWILKKEKDAIEIEPIHIAGLQTDEPIMQWRKQSFNPQIKNTLRIFPSQMMEGFFVAKIRKLKSTIKV